ncbi:MAG: glutaminyl-peptide cyclotransferase [Crocinitomicaceae bacterium]|nr:glutaminyl-peptide cyclotransferase [Crocinitomicaceae bacterium]MDG1776778.1 glutaminyl-peptide cyclotransferase [Crocinitomicaceae bacterium]
MKKIILIALILVVGGSLLIYPLLKEEAPVFKNKQRSNAAIFTFKENLAVVGDEQVPLEIKINKEITKSDLYYNDSLIMSWDAPAGVLTYLFSPGMFGVGTRTLNLLSTLADGSTFVDNRKVRVLSDVIPQVMTTKIINTHPHNPTSFTQGLAFYKGLLYEGTGDPGNQGLTTVARVDLTTGEIKQKMGLSAGFFGEGITILNNTLYQLTWQNQTCYTYDVTQNLQLKGEFNYADEGWGLCNDGAHLIMSDGSERITFRSPETFEISHTIEVYNNQGPVNYLNELEYIEGKIYANVWTTNAVVVIDPVNGKVLQEINATNLVLKGQGTGEVLNGIAHNSATGKTYMTGKYWGKLFEVDFVEPGL